MMADREGTGPIAPLVATYLVALLAQIVYLFTIRTEPTFRVPIVDSATYLAAAEAIGRGEALPGAPLQYGPLYPILLGLFHRVAGGDPFGTRLLQSLVTSLTAPLTALLAGTLFGGAAALFAGIATALYWPLLFYGGEFLIEPVLLPILLLFVLLALRAEARPRVSRSFAAGLLLGLAATARPNTLLLLPFFVARAAVRRRAAHALALLAGCVLPIVPVTAYNALAGKDFVILTSTAGINFYIGNNEKATGRDSSFPGIVPWSFEKVRRLAEMNEGRAMKESEVSRHYLARGLRFVTHHPAAWALLMGKKAIHLLSSHEVPNVKDPAFYRARSPFLSLPFFIGFGVIAPLALAGIARRPGARETPLLLALAAYSLSVLLFFVNARYRLPLIPFFIVYAAAGATRLARALRRRTPGGARPVLLVAAGFVLFNWNPLGGTDDLSQIHFNEGWAAQRGGDASRAMDEYRLVSPESPWRAPALNNRAVLLLGRGEVRGALADLLRAVARDSTYYEAWSNIGRVYYEAERYDEAIVAFEKAALLWPGDPSYLTNLGLARKGAGDLDGALAAFLSALESDARFEKARIQAVETLFALGRGDEARPYLERLLREEPENAAAWYYAALLHREEGREEEARAAWREAIRLAPEGPLAAKARAMLDE